MRDKSVITKKLCFNAYKIVEYRHELVMFWISVLQLKSLVLLTKQKSGSFSFMSSYKRFTFSGIIPKSLTILSQFLQMVQMGVQFHYSTCGYCFPAPTFEKTTLQSMSILEPLSKSVDHIHVDLFLGSIFCSICLHVSVYINNKLF